MRIINKKIYVSDFNVRMERGSDMWGKLDNLMRVMEDTKIYIHVHMLAQGLHTGDKIGMTEALYLLLCVVHKIAKRDETYMQVTLVDKLVPLLKQLHLTVSDFATNLPERAALSELDTIERDLMHDAASGFCVGAKRTLECIDGVFVEMQYV